MDRNRLENLLSDNILIISFFRRTYPVGRVRRMICTKSDILTSFQGRVNLNYRPPKHSPTINQKEHNIVIVWDILCQDYRWVPCESVNIIEVIPKNEFWNYYNNALLPMSKRDKIAFMNG